MINLIFNLIMFHVIHYLLLFLKFKFKFESDSKSKSRSILAYLQI
jgi:hypothetical protein